MRFFLRFLTMLPFLIAAPAFAWGPEGHEIAAKIAADNLTPRAHLMVSQILGGDAPSRMILESSWADEIRSDRPQTTNWHFVNIELGSKGYDASRDCARDNCVVAQINRDLGVLRDPRSPRDAKLEAMRFLIHFAADLHQPLHAADRYDKGGNSLTVFLNRKRSNLHRVWDQDVVEGLGPDPMQAAADIEAHLSSADRTKIMSGTPNDWINETFQLASREIYARLPPKGPVTLPRDYAKREANVVRLQLARAGLRLAMVLNAVYR
jgi:hypothetical protein